MLDNSPEKRNLDDKRYEMRLFQLYDGTLVLRGYTKLLFKDIEIGQEDIQVLPPQMRDLFEHKGFANKVRRKLFYLLRRIESWLI